MRKQNAEQIRKHILTIKRKNKFRNLNQVAELTGFNAQMLSNWQNGFVSPSGKTLEKLADWAGEDFVILSENSN